MKRTLSIFLLAAFLCTSASPALAQQTREIKPTKPVNSPSGNRFASVRAFSDGSGVLVEWDMAVETNNGGFQVIRSNAEGSTVITDSMILGSAAMYGSRPVSGEKYRFFDVEGDPGSVYSVEFRTLEGVTGTSNPAAVESVSVLSQKVADIEMYRQAATTKGNGSITSQRLQFPKPIVSEMDQYRVAADANQHAWVVSQPGVRIGVKGEGFYRVSKVELAAAGFDVDGDSSRWQLYREGVQIAINVAPNAEYIEFYGKGVDRLETDTAVYFLVSGPTAGKRIARRVARPVAGTVTSPNYSQVFTQKQRTRYLNQVLNGDEENFWGSTITVGNNTTYNFQLSGVDFSVPDSTLNLKFQGYSFHSHSIQVTLNGEPLAPATGNSRSAFSKQYTIPTSYLREGANSLVFRGAGATGSFCLFNSVSIGFARKQLASQNRLRFYTSNYKLSKLEGFSSPNIRVLDLTNENEPVEWTSLNVVPEGPTYSVRMPADRGRSMFAFENSANLLASSVTPHEPANLKNASNAANLVIISHKNWMNEAQDWADYRMSQGFSVKVVDISSIYDEFSYGDFNSLAIREFLSYAKNNWQVGPSYALLLGDATYDYRNYEGFGDHNYVPTHLVDTVFTETGSDEYLADFNGDGVAEIAIGRIPARTGQAVAEALNKVIVFEQSAPTIYGRGVLFAYDCYDGDNNYDFQQISVNLRNQLPGGVPVTMAGKCDSAPLPETPQSVLINSMNTGKLFVNYSGHGSSGAWAVDYFGNPHVPQLTNVNNPSLYTMLTCLNGYFLQTTNNSLAESLLAHGNGGAVASWASTGETTPDVQEAMATRFFQRLGQGQITRLGDLVNDAKSVIVGGTDVRLSWALLGDPMLMVGTPIIGDRPVAKKK